MNNERIIVRARDLRAGDYLPMTNETVLYSERGARTPARKSEVALERSNGSKHLAIWNSDTKIVVLRAVAS